MAIAIVALSALFASALTMFSGFGLGTLLMPVFALFFPVELAVAATAVVHGSNNVLKAALLGRRADPHILVRFGLPAIVAASVGASALGALSRLTPLASYALFGRVATVTPLKLVMASLMIGFAALELHPRFEKLEFDRKLLPLGGILSGFFGGLSGHQGALRSAFLAKVGVSPEAFVGSNAVLGLVVDLTRLSVYATLARGGAFEALIEPRNGRLIVAGTLAAFAGVVAGKRLIKKITMRSVQRITGAMLLVIAALLATGLV